VFSCCRWCKRYKSSALTSKRYKRFVCRRADELLFLYFSKIQGHHQVQQTGVDNTGRGLGRGVPFPVGDGVAPPQKNKIKFSVWKGVFWRILSKLVWILPWCNSLRFYGVFILLHTDFTIEAGLTCTSIWNFPVKYTAGLYHKKFINFNITRTKTSYTVAYYVTYSLDWIGSLRLSSTLNSLPTPSPNMTI